MFPGTEREIVMQESIMTRIGVDRVLKFAFELAQTRPKKHLTSATKSNGIAITMPYWDERVAEMAKAYPGVNVDKFHIDILTAHFVQRPDFFDVVVASNLFGDILSDLGPACTGTIGIAPSANLNPDRKFPSLFEPVHGSAPDIAGLGLSQPDWTNLVRRHDAGVFGSQRRTRCGAGRYREGFGCGWRCATHARFGWQCLYGRCGSGHRAGALSRRLFKRMVPKVSIQANWTGLDIK
jgi:hypothetical protein